MNTRGEGLQWLLISLVVALIVAWIPFEFFRREALQRIHHHLPIEDVVATIFLTATFGLISISPFRFRSNRRIATISLLIGISALIYLFVLPMHG